MLVLMLLASAHTAHAQVDPTTNFRMWGSPSFNRQIGPDEVVVQVAGGSYHTIALLDPDIYQCKNDQDGDEVCDEDDLCPNDPDKSEPGDCGCGVPDTDTDDDGTPDCRECRGDITENGVIDGGDLGILLALWGTDGKTNPNADINNDGTIDGADLGLILGYWGTCP